MTNRRMWMGGLVLAAMAVSVTAQGPGPGRFGGGGGFGNRLDFLAGYLNLTETQKTQAKAIFDAAAASGETARGQLTSAREALRTAIKAGQTDAQLDQLAAAVGVIEGQLTGIQAKAESKFYALLTTEQKAKYDSLRSRSGPRGD